LGGTKFKTGSIELELSICLRDRLGESAERVEEDSAYKLKLLLFIETLWREGLDVSLGRLIINNLKKNIKKKGEKEKRIKIGKMTFILNLHCEKMSASVYNIKCKTYYSIKTL
jgi:hypothetical protein